jgi:hypothetical protein
VLLANPERTIANKAETEKIEQKPYSGFAIQRQICCLPHPRNLFSQALPNQGEYQHKLPIPFDQHLNDEQ